MNSSGNFVSTDDINNIIDLTEIRLENIHNPTSNASSQ